MNSYRELEHIYVIQSVAKDLLKVARCYLKGDPSQRSGRRNFFSLMEVGPFLLFSSLSLRIFNEELSRYF